MSKKDRWNATEDKVQRNPWDKMVANDDFLSARNRRKGDHFDLTYVLVLLAFAVILVTVVALCR